MDGLLGILAGGIEEAREYLNAEMDKTSKLSKVYAGVALACFCGLVMALIPRIKKYNHEKAVKQR